MTAPSFVQGEWRFPDDLDQRECPESILLRQFSMPESTTTASTVLAEPTTVQIVQESQRLEESQQSTPKPFSYTGPPHPLAQRGLEKLLRPPPDCESQLIQPKKLNLKRYSDSSFYQTSGNVYPTIDEQKQLCKLISASLFSDENRDARGRDMFQKKLSKIEDFSQEGQGSNDQRNAVDDYLNGVAGPGVPGFPQAPIRTFLTEQSLTSNIYTSNEFQQFHNEAHATHDGITPDQAFGLIQGLKNQQNRGAEIFEQRKASADRWIIDETNVKKPTPRSTPTIFKMVEEMNRPMYENWAATLPPVTQAAPPPGEILDLNKIMEQAKISQEPEQEPVSAPAEEEPEKAEEPAEEPEAEPEPTPEEPVVVEKEPSPAPEPEPEPEPVAQETPSLPAQLPSAFKCDIKAFMGYGPTGWKSIKPPGK